MFRTEIQIPSSPIRITHDCHILTMGSCFSNTIGEKLQKNKFNVLVNPFGTIFNPESIFNLLASSATKNNIFDDLFIEHQNLWYNYHLHSDLHAESKEALKLLIEKSTGHTLEFIKNAHIITLTLGTAFVYKLKSSGRIVANCHKVPATNFRKELLTVQEIVKSFNTMYDSISFLNPDIKIILTVSPVRHIKDTIELNSVSKAILRTACHTIMNEGYKNISYFPAFEIMMDDLRDYRYYKEDMLHPTAVAETYIWEKFIDTYMEEPSKDFIKEWTNILKALEHKPFHPHTEAHQRFIRETIKKLNSLGKYVNVEEEIKTLEEQLN
jgi:hypothetical protein